MASCLVDANRELASDGLQITLGDRFVVCLCCIVLEQEKKLHYLLGRNVCLIDVSFSRPNIKPKYHKNMTISPNSTLRKKQNKSIVGVDLK